MDRFSALISDIGDLLAVYWKSYLINLGNTLLLALVATAIGCLIGLICGILNTIPYTKNDPLPKRFLLKLIRIIVRVYVEAVSYTHLSSSSRRAGSWASSRRRSTGRTTWST